MRPSTGEYPTDWPEIAKSVKDVCSNCGRPYKPLRKGRCQRCYQYWRRHDCEHPESLLSCTCGECDTCRNRENARRRYHGVVYTNLAAGRFQASELKMPIAPAILGYIAGIMDGEGCITRQNGSWRIQIGMTDEEIIRWFGEIGGKIRADESRKGGRKVCWRWLLCKQLEVADFLSEILPYMRVKRSKALATLNDIASRESKRFEPRKSREKDYEKIDG